MSPAIARPSLATTYPLTRFAGPGWEQLIPAEFLNRTEVFFKSASEQHPMRRWEYSMAQLALSIWEAAGFRERRPRGRRDFADVGGAGSPLRNMLAGPDRCIVTVDPNADGLVCYRGTVQDYAVDPNYQTNRDYDAVLSISVLEHVDDVDSFLSACDRLLAPGGLLFLTVDAWDPPVTGAKDTAHFHWMRKRIFDREGLLWLAARSGYEPLGAVDLTYQGNTVYDYSFASVAMVKEG